MIVLAMTEQALAEPDGKALAAFGLVGTWAVNCGLPPSGKNPYVFYSVPAKAPPTSRVGTGRYAPELVTRMLSTARLKNVRIISSEWLAYDHVYGNGRVVKIVVRKSDNRIGTWVSIDESGRAIILQGHYVDTVEDVSLLKRCA